MCFSSGPSADEIYESIKPSEQALPDLPTSRRYELEGGAEKKASSVRKARSLFQPYGTS